MSSRELSLYSPSDITRADSQDGAVAITIAQNARPAVVLLDEAGTTISGTVFGTEYHHEPMVIEHPLPLLGSGGEVFEIRFASDSTAAGIGFSFPPTPGVTYYSSANPTNAEPDAHLFTCFAKGTKVETKAGLRLIEDLQAGDLLWTEANGFQPLRWVGTSTVAAKGSLAPVVFRAGVFGITDDLWVSQAHKMLIGGPEVELLFGLEKALVAAKDLLNETTITIDTSRDTLSYYHIMFDHHQIVRANGALSESFFASQAAVSALDKTLQNELQQVFPDLATLINDTEPAYPSLLSFEVSLLSI